MTLTPAMKGQLTRITKQHVAISKMSPFYANQTQYRYGKVREIFTKIMPAEQAKHAARRYLSSVEGA